jgi:hypothetical protein
MVRQTLVPICHRVLTCVPFALFLVIFFLSLYKALRYSPHILSLPRLFKFKQPNYLVQEHTLSYILSLVIYVIVPYPRRSMFSFVVSAHFVYVIVVLSHRANLCAVF